MNPTAVTDEPLFAENDHTRLNRIGLRVRTILLTGILTLELILFTVFALVFKPQMHVTLLAGALFFLLCGWVTAVFLARRICRPIDDLVASVRAISNGDYDRPIKIHSYEEMAYLGAETALMQERLKEQFDILANTNEQLMISNQRLESEIAEREKKEAQIRYLAFYDSMTHLPNREFLKIQLEHKLTEAKRAQQMIAILFLDLDHFKRINDTLGHKTGDELLCAVARRLTKSVNEAGDIAANNSDFSNKKLIAANSDHTVARLGGDEFVVVLDDLQTEFDAIAAAQNISRLLARPFELGEWQVFVTSSIGISRYPADGEDAETLLKHADLAMYHAKELGRHQYQLYTSSMDADIQERLALETSLRDSLKQKRFMVFFQPKADARTGQIVGAEALLRWVHPEKGVISPGKFIPIAEETGLIIALGEWVLRTACEQCKAWQASGLAPLRVSVNMSVAQFRQKDLLQTVTAALADSGLSPEYLELELTESLLMENLDSTIALLNELKSIGLQLSIDDFGTGYSSLNYLKQLPIDTLKIDRSFVHDIETSPDDANIVTATIALGHKLRLKVIAEGVEKRSQLKLLREHECDEIQGYLLSRPLPAGEFKRYLQLNQNRIAVLDMPVKIAKLL